MKHRFFNIFGVLLVIIMIGSSCGSTKDAITISQEEKMAFAEQEGDTIKIASDVTEYEIIIIEPGFNFWLQSIAKPEGYYSQSYLENRNNLYVIEWNQRVLQPFRYDPGLYELQIDYSPNIDYGYEVNYKLYNYFIYFQRKYNQRLGPFVPRI
ncbi:MAG: DUF6146 family protein [Maribacter sp.]|uniref:DUF6146 family protein n=1 Tax=Maribacter sp. TaxID=1897614 RepID=UPI003C75EE76